MEFHENAVQCIEELLSQSGHWAIPWPCVHEFIAVVTNGRIFKTPTPLLVAFDTIQSWKQGRNVFFLNESADHIQTLKDISIPAKVAAARIHDARIATICIDQGVSELWTSDRDFSSFPRLNVVNPLVRGR